MPETLPLLLPMLLPIFPATSTTTSASPRPDTHAPPPPAHYPVNRLALLSKLQIKVFSKYASFWGLGRWVPSVDSSLHWYLACGSGSGRQTSRTFDDLGGVNPGSFWDSLRSPLPFVPRFSSFQITAVFVVVVVLGMRNQFCYDNKRGQLLLYRCTSNLVDLPIPGQDPCRLPVCRFAFFEPTQST